MSSSWWTLIRFRLPDPVGGFNRHADAQRGGHEPAVGGRRVLRVGEFAPAQQHPQRKRHDSFDQQVRHDGWQRKQELIFL